MRRFAASTKTGEKSMAEIAFRTGIFRQREGEASGAAADIENAFPILKPGKIDEPGREPSAPAPHQLLVTIGTFDTLKLDGIAVSPQKEASKRDNVRTNIRTARATPQANRLSAVSRNFGRKTAAQFSRTSADFRFAPHDRDAAYYFTLASRSPNAASKSSRLKFCGSSCPSLMP